MHARSSFPVAEAARLAVLPTKTTPRSRSPTTNAARAHLLILNPTTPALLLGFFLTLKKNPKKLSWRVATVSWNKTSKVQPPLRTEEGTVPPHPPPHLCGLTSSRRSPRPRAFAPVARPPRAFRLPPLPDGQGFGSEAEVGERCLPAPARADGCPLPERLPLPYPHTLPRVTPYFTLWSPSPQRAAADSQH